VILLPSSVRVYVATSPANLRKSFEGLSNEVRTVLAADPLGSDPEKGAKRGRRSEAGSPRNSIGFSVRVDEPGMG
jgi:hypothetical protein